MELLIYAIAAIWILAIPMMILGFREKWREAKRNVARRNRHKNDKVSIAQFELRI